MDKDYENITILQAMKIGLLLGFRNYFALGAVLWQCLTNRPACR
jgi:hypothetical protein